MQPQTVLRSGAPSKLIGIARMAAESSLLIEKRRVEYRNLPTRKWLNRCHSERAPFHWTINPYRGCEFGCKYCYARFTHDFLERREPALFETEIYAKDWNAAEFRNELRSLKAGQVIGLGTATDPYQPAERRFGLTGKVLEAMREVRDIALFVTTKSNLVSRDAGLFRALAEKNEVLVTVTVTTMNRELARLTEPYAPSPETRMRGVAELAEAGVQVGVSASPILPLISDSEDNLRAVAEAAKAAGASQFGAHVVFLQPCAQRVFYPFLAEKFPEHLGRYKKSYQEGAYLTGSYPQRMRDLVQAIREEVGISERELRREAAGPARAPQMLLF